jgi:hypothetical protein
VFFASAVTERVDAAAVSAFVSSRRLTSADFRGGSSGHSIFIVTEAGWWVWCYTPAGGVDLLLVNHGLKFKNMLLT